MCVATFVALASIVNLRLWQHCAYDLLCGWPGYFCHKHGMFWHLVWNIQWSLSYIYQKVTNPVLSFKKKKKTTKNMAPWPSGFALPDVKNAMTPCNKVVPWFHAYKLTVSVTTLSVVFGFVDINESSHIHIRWVWYDTYWENADRIFTVWHIKCVKWQHFIPVTDL